MPRTLRISFDGDSWQAMDTDGNYFTLETEDKLLLPELPDGSMVSNLLMPVESVFSRVFSLPLSSTRFIDQDILAQEMEEYTAEDVADWWLAWQAGYAEDGVAGVMFGLPETVREQIDTHPAWQSLQTIGVDILARLSAQFNAEEGASLDHRADGMVHGDRPIAVFDVDGSGVFFGVWNGKEANDSGGYWRGMRRLNWSEGMLAEVQWPVLAENIKRSLHAMGWQKEGDGGDESKKKNEFAGEFTDEFTGEFTDKRTDEFTDAVGRLLPDLYAALNLTGWQGTLIAPEDLSTRHTENLALSPKAGLNFRHGRWNSRHGFSQLKPWYRSLAIAAALVVVWVAAMLWQNHHLETQLEAAQQHIIQSFHKGLPNEKVMIDALAQLRKAAGGAAGGVTGGERGNSALLWLQEVEGVQRVYQKTPWKIKVLSLDHGKTTMTGSVIDLQSMNKIREALQKEMGTVVKILDTDLSSAQIQFRMAW